MALPSPLKAEVHEVTGEVLESEALRVEGLRQLRAAFAAQKKAPKLVRDDDAFLLAFLRARKYEVPRALKVLNTFCSFWSSNAHIIGARAAWRADTIHSCRAEAALTL